MADKAAAAAKGQSARKLREQEKLAERSALIQRQVANGTLVIRQMTEAEREFWGPPPPSTGKKRKRA